MLQVHDEIILESPDAEIAPASELTRDVMRGAFELRVPLEVDLQVAGHLGRSQGIAEIRRRPGLVRPLGPVASLGPLTPTDQPGKTP